MLSSFSSKIKAKDVRWNNFFDRVVAPIVLKLFKKVLKTCGPKVMADLKCLTLTKAQTQTVADIEETLTLFAQRRAIGNTMRDAMPKALYWLGTSLL